MNTTPLRPHSTRRHVGAAALQALTLAFLLFAGVVLYQADQLGYLTP
jgi:hypothetical protein